MMDEFFEKYSDVICDYVIIILTVVMVGSMILWGEI